MQGSWVLQNDQQSQIESILYPILTTGKVTRSDQQKLLSFMLSNPQLQPEEMKKIKRVIDCLRQGGYTVVD